MTNITFFCPFCNRETNIKASYNPVGKEKKCSGCQKKFVLDHSTMNKQVFQVEQPYTSSAQQQLFVNPRQRPFADKTYQRSNHTSEKRKVSRRRSNTRLQRKKSSRVSKAKERMFISNADKEKQNLFLRVFSRLGRVSRLEFIAGLLLTFVWLSILNSIFALVFLLLASTNYSRTALIFFGMIIVTNVCAVMPLVIKRLQDAEKTRWYSLGLIIPLLVIAYVFYTLTSKNMLQSQILLGICATIIAVFFIYIASFKGMQGDNIHGEDPTQKDRKAMASFDLRIIAWVIDILVFLPIGIVTAKLELNLLGGALWIMYLVGMHTFYGATLGKKLMKIKVVSNDGGNLSFLQVCVRVLPFCFPVLWSIIAEFMYTPFDLPTIYKIANFLTIFVLLDCMSAGFHPNVCSLHDLLAKSYCVDTQSKHLETFFQQKDSEVQSLPRKHRSRKTAQLSTPVVLVIVLCLSLPLSFIFASPVSIKKRLTVAEQHMEKAKNWVIKRDFQKAMDECNKAIAANKNCTEAYIYKADIFNAYKDHVKAIQIYKEAIAIDNTNSQSYSKLGMAYLGAKKYDLAQDSFAIALKLNKTNYVAQRGLERITTLKQLEKLSK